MTETRVPDVPPETTVEDFWVEDDSMRINIGPQHPSTHGVLRLQVEVSGETVESVQPVFGYLHTGIEKQAETLNWIQVVTDVTRADYLSPFHNETAYSMAVEQLAGVEVPRRGQWIRVLMLELNRLTSHLIWLATTGLELGAMSMATYGFREREYVLDLFQEITGLRMNHAYIRPGGVNMDILPEHEEQVREVLDLLKSRLDEYEDFLATNPIWVRRNRDVGVLSTEAALRLGVTGPVLRATGLAYDMRKKPGATTLPYDEFDFDVVTGDQGDCYDRYLVRMGEMRESVRICEQVLDGLPSGPFRAQGKLVPPPRNRLPVSMEAVIHHFKLFTEGPHVPAGEAYASLEGPRGELGCYVASDGRGRPWRVHLRSPSMVNLSAIREIAPGHFIADLIAILASLDPVMGDIDR